MISGVPISSGRIRLPNLDQGIPDRLAVAVENASADNDAFAEWFAFMLDRQVVVVFADPLVTINWPGDL